MDAVSGDAHGTDTAIVVYETPQSVIQKVELPVVSRIDVLVTRVSLDVCGGGVQAEWSGCILVVDSLCDM